MANAGVERPNHISQPRVSRHPHLQQSHQLRIHESVIIREQMTRAFFRLSLNFFCSLVRCAFSITKTMSAQATSSCVSGVWASWVVPP